MCEECEDLCTRLEDHIRDFEAYQSQVVAPQLEAMRADRDDLIEMMGEQAARNKALERWVKHLEATIDSVIGVAEGEKSTPAKRCTDLRLGLIRRAEARADNDGAGKASMYYKEVQDFLAEIGHGKVHRPECVDAMREAAKTDGFQMGTKTSRHGNEVMAIIVDLEHLPAGVACRDPTTRQSASPVRERINTGGDTRNVSFH